VLIFTNHHLILDGWSTPLLVGEMLEVYRDGVDANHLAPAARYSDYLAWLATQDDSAALGIWEDYLSGVEAPTTIAPHTPGGGPQGLLVSRRQDLPPELTHSLHAMAQSRGLTLNTVLQGLWAVLLARLTNLDDIVFGITVSGRPPEVTGIEQMVG